MSSAMSAASLRRSTQTKKGGRAHYSVRCRVGEPSDLYSGEGGADEFWRRAMGTGAPKRLDLARRGVPRLADNARYGNRPRGATPGRGQEKPAEASALFGHS